MPDKPFSAACERNRDPILAVLRTHFAGCRRVLEVGSGTGQHAVHFAAALPQLAWQTADREENHPGIRLWIEDSGLANVLAPLALDVDDVDWAALGTYDAVFSANTLHIMGWPQVQKLFAGLPQVMGAGARLVVYGPFNYGGRFTSASNEQFEKTLKTWGEHMGIRDFEAVDALAHEAGLELVDDRAMPANNRSLVWRRGPEGDGRV